MKIRIVVPIVSSDGTTTMLAARNNLEQIERRELKAYQVQGASPCHTTRRVQKCTISSINRSDSVVAYSSATANEFIDSA